MVTPALCISGIHFHWPKWQATIQGLHICNGIAHISDLVQMHWGLSAFIWESLFSAKIRVLCVGHASRLCGDGGVGACVAGEADLGGGGGGGGVICRAAHTGPARAPPSRPPCLTPGLADGGPATYTENVKGKTWGDQKGSTEMGLEDTSWADGGHPPPCPRPCRPRGAGMATVVSVSPMPGPSPALGPPPPPAIMGPGPH